MMKNYKSDKYLRHGASGSFAGDEYISGQWYFCPATVRADNNSGLPQKHSFCGKREQSPDKRCFCRKAKRAQRRIANAVAGNGGSSVGWRRGEIPMECFCKAPSVIALKDWTVWSVIKKYNRRTCIITAVQLPFIKAYIHNPCSGIRYECEGTPRDIRA